MEQILLKNSDLPTSHLLSTYEETGGYQALRKILADFTSEKVIEWVKSANLLGRGGAGFPTGLKWSFVPRDTGKPIYLCCNADESEPGTFKDRFLMERDPHLMLEGMVIAAYAVGAEVAYIYIRGEYSECIHKVEAAIVEATAKGYIGQNILGSGFSLSMHVHTGAGAYICGEETALLESIEGRRAQPKLKPPFPAVAGLYECPTIINNVETFACLPMIFERGPEWFRGIGPEASPGPKLYCVSGNVVNPGLYELPMGISLHDLVKEAGGPKHGAIKAVIPGGVSAPMIPAEGLGVRMDFKSLAAVDSMLGSAGVIVLDETACVVRVAESITEFFDNESCGKCTPCREGLGWALQILKRIEAGKGEARDIDELEFLCGGIFGNSFCALGDGAAWALAATIKHFRHEFEEHIEGGGCPFH